MYSSDVRPQGRKTNVWIVSHYASSRKLHLATQVTPYDTELNYIKLLT